MDIETMKNIVEHDIHEKGLESLHYVLFDEQDRTPFAVHIFYEDGLFKVNSRDERSYVVGKTFEFRNFNEAETKFFNVLDFIVREGRRDVKVRGGYMYPSPLWDND